MNLDSLIGLISPKWQLSRLQAKASIAQFHQYAGAQTGRDRTPPKPLRSPDSPSAQADALAMLRRSQDLGRDSAFIGYLVKQYQIYGFGDLSYIPNTGNKDINRAYRKFWMKWMENCDKQGRFHFIDLLQKSIAGIIYNGRHGLIHHYNDDGTFQLQSVMGYNIGNPRAVYTDPNLIQGIVLDPLGKPVGYQIFRLQLNGTAQYVETIPAEIFSFLNPVVTTDEYSSKTPLHAVLNDAHDMKRVEDAWMKKIQWAAYKTAIFNTPNGSPPGADPNTNELDSAGGYEGTPAQGRIRHQLPGEELHGEIGFNVEMLKNENPTNNEMEFLTTKLAQISLSLGLPLPFVWVMMGLPGTYTRLVSEQAKRAFQHGPMGQKWLERVALNEIKRSALMSGIIRGEIPLVENWNEGNFMYPAHPTVYVGRESAANLNENRQGIKSMAQITSEEGYYWEDVDDQLAAEAFNKLRLAHDIAKQLREKTGEMITWRDTIGFIQTMSANPTGPEQNSESLAAAIINQTYE